MWLEPAWDQLHFPCVSVISVSVKLLFISVHISKICSLSCCCLVVFSCDVDSGKLKMITLLSLFFLSFCLLILCSVLLLEFVRLLHSG